MHHQACSNNISHTQLFMKIGVSSPTRSTLIMELEAQALLLLAIIAAKFH